MTSSRAIMWFRRDLRTHDNPALLQAATLGADGVLPLFVVDRRLWHPAGKVRRAFLVRSLRALNSTLAGNLHVMIGDPICVLPEAARQIDAHDVVVSSDFGPYGTQRDNAVEDALTHSGVKLSRVGSPYAVAPGRVLKSDRSPYRVFTPYYRAWLHHGWRQPAAVPNEIQWVSPRVPVPWPDEPVFDDSHLPTAGEAAALRQWDTFLTNGVDGYEAARDRPDLDASSRLSVHLKFGELHPRTMLAELGDVASHESFRRQLAWREFYADVMHHHPESARGYLRKEFSQMEYSDPSAEPEHLDAWKQGVTGYPIVDAGMRQLLTEGWMHNRVRMVVASFLVKDLHYEWQVGARWFMQHLVDGDLASNSHGWQWTAGCGTDSAPYFRVFNPVTQGRKFDPDGDYVKRHVPELRHLEGGSVHEPWRVAGGYLAGYPARIVNHQIERRVALDRYAAMRGG